MNLKLALKQRLMNEMRIRLYFLGGLISSHFLCAPIRQRADSGGWLLNNCMTPFSKALRVHQHRRSGLPLHDGCYPCVSGLCRGELVTAESIH
jgi:hypothetical protein